MQTDVGKLLLINPHDKLKICEFRILIQGTTHQQQQPNTQPIKRLYHLILCHRFVSLFARVLFCKALFLLSIFNDLLGLLFVDGWPSAYVFACVTLRLSHIKQTVSASMRRDASAKMRIACVMHVVKPKRKRASCFL